MTESSSASGEQHFADFDALLLYDPVAALEELERRIRIAGPTVGLLVRRARAQVGLGCVSEARISMAEARRRGPNACEAIELTAVEALVQMAEGETDAAIATLRLGVKKFPASDTSALHRALSWALASLRRFDELLAEAPRGVEVAIAHADIGSQLAIQNNRAVALLETGRSEEARAAFEHILDVSSGHESETIVLAATHNLAVIHARRGDIPEALRQFAETRRRVSSQDGLTFTNRDEGEALMDAGLFDEAWNAGRRAERAARSIALSPEIFSSIELQARASAASGNWRKARREISRLEHELDSAQPEGDDDLRRRVGALALLVLARTNPTSAVEKLKLPEARQSIVFGNPRIAFDLALVLDDISERELTFDVLTQIANSGSGRTAIENLFVAVAGVLVADRRGDAAAEGLATSALATAYDLLDRIPSMELRQEVSRAIHHVSTIIVNGHIRRGALVELRDHLDELRVRSQVVELLVDSEQASLLLILRETARALDGLEPGTPESLSLQRECHEIEDAIRQLRRLGPHTNRSEQSPQRVSEGGLCYMTLASGRVYGLVEGTDGRLELVDIGEETRLRSNINALRSVLSVGAYGKFGGDWKALRGNIQTQLAPLVSRFDRPRMLIVPDPGLPMIPWPMITSIPVASIPNASFRTSACAGVDGSAVLVSGPGLSTADQEIAAIAKHYGDRAVLFDSASSEVGKVLAAAQGASIAHFAAHGSIRSDHTLLSSLHLRDGALTLYDLLQHSAPRYAVLAACDLGRGMSSSSLALALTLLSRGCHGLIASTGVISDAGTLEVMSAFHADLAAGVDFVEAIHSNVHNAVEDAPSVGQLFVYGAG